MRVKEMVKIGLQSKAIDYVKKEKEDKWIF